MKNCKVCKGKFNYKVNLKSLLNRRGEITCTNCNTKFKRKNSFMSNLIGLFLLLIIIYIFDNVGGILGVIMASIFAIAITAIELNTNIFYIQIK